ncbi:MAG: hypothetical protein IKA58_06765 [Clostridia bacterium]|nr:hypothetical protein [Clostridia bacterium]
MLFYTFNSQDERRRYGGSAFIEMQFCTLPAGTTIEELVAVDSIKHWLNDSLYIDDENAFYEAYSHIFDCGVYNNLKRGVVDIYGINYYSPAATDSIIEKVLKDKPQDYEPLLEWLRKAKEYNGFYVLGL